MSDLELVALILAQLAWGFLCGWRARGAREARREREGTDR